MSNLKNKNILFLASWYPTRVLPTNGNFIFKHARSLVRKGIPITVLAVCEDQSISKRFEFIEGKEEGVEHLIIYYNYPFRILKFFFKALAYFRGIRFLEKKKGRFDLIHVHVLIDAGFIAWWNYVWRRTPYLITEHNSIFLPENPDRILFPVKWLIKWTIRNSTYVLPVSKALVFYMKKYHSRTPFKVIPNVVDSKLFQLSTRAAQNKKFKFIHISNFADLKNVKGLLNAVKELSKKRTDFIITIAGEGDLEDLQRYSKSIRMPAIVNFIGEMTEKEVSAQFSKHDAFVLFSDYENLPCVLVEAQMCGMPSIATDVGAVREILSSEDYGILIQARDESALVKSLEYMIDNFSLYDSHKIRREAIEKYSDSAVAEAFINVYQEVLND